MPRVSTAARRRGARASILIGFAVLVALLSTANLWSRQGPAIRAVDEATLRGFTGVYEWKPNGFLYLQLWAELSGSKQLVAVDENGEVRTLYSTGPDRFFAGPGAALPESVESRIEFHRD